MINGRTDEEWAQILDCSPAAVRRAIENLLARGLIEEIEPEQAKLANAHQ